MKSKLFIPICVTLLIIISCKNDDSDNPVNTTTELQVLTDFANYLVNPNYQDIQAKANTLNLSVQTLSTNTTDANLAAARIAWRETRIAWEKAESFLFGPVEDFSYDPTMDDWPVNRVDLDSILASSNQLTLADIDALPTNSLKGFHPIEYLLFGIGGSKLAINFTEREKLYLVSLTQSLYNTTTDLRNSWDVNHGNFTDQFITAGNGSVRFPTRKDAFIAIATAMAGICDEVANGKMEDPLAAQDSTLEESQFAHSSTADFKNNIIGIQNAYLSKYISDGHGLNEIISAKNLSLDQTLQSQINAAINSFNAINSNYGAAIYTQQIQIHNAQNAINLLRNTIEIDLMDFIQIYIKD